MQNQYKKYTDVKVEDVLTWGSEFMKEKDNKQQMIERQEAILNDYLKEIGKPEYDVLDREEEARLIRLYKEKGDLDAKEQVILHNIRLVPYLIRSYNIYSSDPMDLIQSGMVGLIEALDKFDVNNDVRFGSYALYAIRKHVLNTVSNDLNKVYIPFGMTYYTEKYKKMKKAAEKEGKVLSDEEAIEILGLNSTTFNSVKATAAIEYVSLSAPLVSDGEGKTFVLDLIPDPDTIEPDRDMMVEEQHNILVEALQVLPPRDYDIIVHTFGFGCDKEPAKEMADRYGITVERVYQIKKGACNKLRKAFKRNGITNPELDI